MFWFLLIALVVVVAAVTLVVVGGDDGVTLPDAPPDRLHDALPAHRQVGRADLEALRLPTTVRGYRMTDVDDVLGRLGAELAERDARIAELEEALAGARSGAPGRGSAPLEESGGGYGAQEGRGGYGAPGPHGEAADHPGREAYGPGGAYGRPDPHAYGRGRPGVEAYGRGDAYRRPGAYGDTGAYGDGGPHGDDGARGAQEGRP